MVKFLLGLAECLMGAAVGLVLAWSIGQDLSLAIELLFRVRDPANLEFWIDGGFIVLGASAGAIHGVFQGREADRELKQWRSQFTDRLWRR